MPRVKFGYIELKGKEGSSRIYYRIGGNRKLEVSVIGRDAPPGVDASCVELSDRSAIEALRKYFGACDDLVNLTRETYSAEDAKNQAREVLGRG